MTLTTKKLEGPATEVKEKVCVLEAAGWVKTFSTIGVPGIIVVHMEPTDEAEEVVFEDEVETYEEDFDPVEEDLRILDELDD